MSEPSLAPRRAADSVTQMSELVLPQHANALGNAFGGTIMSWIDICGAICAQRHSGRVSVTALVDDLAFVAPIRVGDLIVLEARMNAVYRTSMEVEVVVFREDTVNRTRTQCVDARVTFVQLDESGKPMPAPPLLVETEDDQRRVDAANERRRLRLAAKSKG